MEKMLPPGVLHPRALNAIFAIDPATGAAIEDPTLLAVRGAMADAYTDATRLIALRDAVAADPTLTPGAAELRIRDNALKLGEAAAKRLDGARDKATTMLRQLQAETLPPPPADSAMAVEIRAALRRMTDKQRNAVLDAAVATGDAATVGAALSGPLFLSGLNDHGAALAKLGWRLRHHPAEADRMGRIENALDALKLGADGLVSFVKETASRPRAREAEHQLQRAAEAQAAVAESLQAGAS